MTLPKGWLETTLGEIGNWGSGGTPKAGHSEFYSGGIPWVRSGDLPDGPILLHEATISQAGLLNSSAKWVEADAVLIAMYGATIGKVGITTYPVTTNQAVAFVRPAEGIFPNFIFQALRSRRAKFVQLGQGGAQPNISQEIIKAQKILVPPTDEQRRIVAKLDALTARLARTRKELNRVDKLAQRLRLFALARLWSSTERQTLAGLLAEPIRNGLSVAGSEQPPGQPALRLSALRGTIVNLSDVRYIPVSPDRADKYRIEAGDILVSRGNGTLSLVGKASRVGEATGEYPIFPDTAFRLRPDSALVCSEWLLYVWNSPDVRRQIEGVARTTAGIWKISQRDLAQIQLPVASLEDQRRMAAAIDIAFARANRLEAEATRARALLDRLEAAILAKAFRGELVPQDPNDEPASVLLDRIRAERAAAPKPKRGRARKAVG